MYSIGLDIGGTSIKGIVTDEHGTLLTKCKLPTDAFRGPKAILDTLHNIILKLRYDYPEVAGIGVGAAGRINTHLGNVEYATDNLPGWQGVELAKLISEKHKLPAFIDNDANCALLGEAWVGAGRGYHNLIMLTLGTGVGGANMIDGKLVHGANWNGGEWGHVVLVPGGTVCNCGRSGCVEQYLSGTSLTRIATDYVGKVYADGYAFINDVGQGNPKAIEVIDQYVEQLAIFLGNIQLGIDPEAIIIGGGVVESRHTWWSKLELKTAQYRSNGTKVSVLPAQLDNDAGCYGAAKLVFNHLA